MCRYSITRNYAVVQGLYVMLRILLFLYGCVITAFPKILQREDRSFRMRALGNGLTMRPGTVQATEDPVSVPDPQVHPLVHCYDGFPAVLQEQPDFPLPSEAGAAEGNAGTFYGRIGPCNNMPRSAEACRVPASR